MKNDMQNWLDIEAELYPLIFVNKIMKLHGGCLGGLEINVQVPYDTLHRVIDISGPLNQVINDFFGEQKQEVFIFDYEIEKFVSLGQSPFQESVQLKNLFISNQVIEIKVQPFVPQKFRAKTLKEVLEKVAQWRKIHNESQKKLTLEQAAKIVGISRNTLDDYYFIIKSAQKSGFNFQQNLQKPFNNLRKFLKNKQSKETPSPLPHILSKYKPN